MDVFNKKTQKWKNGLKIPEKFRNFHNCMIPVLAQRQIFDSVYKKDSGQYVGILPTLYQTLGQKANFTPFFQATNFEFFAPVNQQIITPVLNVITDWILSRRFITATFEEASTIFVITPAEEYSSYEKLLLPFDDETWKYLLITFSVAFGVVFSVNQMPKFQQEKIYGQGVKTPSFNILGSFFGISQNIEPKENAARILMIYFVMFCLIFRTAYQGEII